MGTRATTRIQEGKDYIELYTRWDGFLPEIQESIVEAGNQWQLFIDLFKNNLVDDAPYTPHLKSWIDNLQNYLNKHVTSPSISTTAFFLSAKSFSHHHPLPSNTTQALCNGWHKNNPSLVAKIYNGKLTFKENKSTLGENTSTTSLDGYKILRIKLIDDSDDQEETYMDVKFKDITIEDLMKEILLIPIFWRDFYTVYKNIYNNMKDPDFYIEVIQSLINKFISFYDGTSAYSEYSLDKKKKEINDRIMSTLRLIPLDTYVNSLATQIAFILPDKVEFLTKSEENSVVEPDVTIYQHGSRLTHILMDLSEDNPIITEVVSAVHERESNFNTYHKVESSVPYQIVQNKDNNYIGIPFEENFVYIMETQNAIVWEDFNK